MPVFKIHLECLSDLIYLFLLPSSLIYSDMYINQIVYERCILVLEENMSFWT